MSDFGTRLKKARKDKKVTQKELARVLGVAQSAIANYENNTRFPGLDILREISDFLNISLDHLLGVEEKIRQKAIKSLESQDYSKTADEFLELLTDFREEQAKDLIKHIHSEGIALTIIIKRIFVPVLRKVGIGWQQGKISVAQEHYITAIIDRLIDYLSESQETAPFNGLSSVFMSPSGEEHVLTLKMASEFFKAAGWKTRFIGTNVPLDSLIDVIKEDKPEVLVMSSLTTEGLNSASYLISALKGELGLESPKVLLGGGILDIERIRKHTKADYILNDLESLPNTIEELKENIKKYRIG
ncbi:MAG TPA: helix-turn-helix domain-containing protein [Gudongella oleilytica]|nr:helix-turn-helix domain-containing protein [Gudongella oleilytica]